MPKKVTIIVEDEKGIWKRTYPLAEKFQITDKRASTPLGYNEFDGAPPIESVRIVFDLTMGDDYDTYLPFTEEILKKEKTDDQD